MPAFLIQLSESQNNVRPEGADSLVVFAADATDAKAIAKGHFDGDGTAWDSATVTQIQAASDLSDAKFKLRCAILDSDTVVDETAEGGVEGATAVAIQAGGSGYSVNDVLTVQGGTSSRACTLRVTSVSTGVVDGVEIIDPGEYTATPSDPVSVTGGTGNDDATFNLTFTTDEYGNFMAEMVGLLNGNGNIANAAIDLGASPPLLTIAGASDSLGDKQVTAEFLYGEVDVPSLLGTVTDEGSAGAALTVEGVASPTLPNVVAATATK